MARKALLVGINRYRDPGADLRGCVNDVREMRDALVGLYGFAGPDVSILADFEATKSAVQRGLESLVAGGRAGDVLVVHFAGHGSSVPDASGDEEDFRDEILCPTDLDWKDPLSDDWLRALFDTTADGVNLTVVLDCCHSGTGTRASLPPDTTEPVERYLPCPLDIRPIEPDRALRGALRRARRGLPGAARPDDVRDADLPEIVLTGCRDDQTAADAYIDGDFHGALTHALVSAMRVSAGVVTYRDLHARAKRLIGLAHDQAPQLEGRAARFDLPFLAPFGR